MRLNEWKNAGGRIKGGSWGGERVAGSEEGRRKIGGREERREEEIGSSK